MEEIGLIPLHAKRVGKEVVALCGPFPSPISNEQKGDIWFSVQHEAMLEFDGASWQYCTIGDENRVVDQLCRANFAEHKIDDTPFGHRILFRRFGEDDWEGTGICVSSGVAFVQAMRHPRRSFDTYDELPF